MNEVHELCRRILGDEAIAVEVAEQVQDAGQTDRVQVLGAAIQACRDRAGQVVDGASPGEFDGLAGAVARELADASSGLPERQREVLALRELLRLSHHQISHAIGIESTAVAPLLARARLGLRARRRGTTAPEGACSERDRALRVLTCRLDSEPVSGEDDRWLFGHLGRCEECSQAHAAMLEASVCYRAWPTT